MDTIKALDQLIKDIDDLDDQLIDIEDAYERYLYESRFYDLY